MGGCRKKNKAKRPLVDAATKAATRAVGSRQKGAKRKAARRHKQEKEEPVFGVGMKAQKRKRGEGLAMYPNAVKSRAYTKAKKDALDVGMSMEEAIEKAGEAYRSAVCPAMRA